MPVLEKRFPLNYPLTQPTTQICHEVLKLVEQKQCEMLIIKYKMVIRVQSNMYEEHF